MLFQNTRRAINTHEITKELLDSKLWTLHFGLHRSLQCFDSSEDVGCSDGIFIPQMHPCVQRHTQKIVMGGVHSLPYGGQLYLVRAVCNIIIMFPNQHFGEVGWHNMHILLHALCLLYFMSISAPSWILEENTFNAATAVCNCKCLNASMLTTAVWARASSIMLQKFEECSQCALISQSRQN